MFNVDQLKNTINKKDAKQKRLEMFRSFKRRDFDGVKPFTRIEKSAKAYRRQRGSQFSYGEE